MHETESDSISVFPAAVSVADSVHFVTEKAPCLLPILWGGFFLANNLDASQQIDQLCTQPEKCYLSTGSQTTRTEPGNQIARLILMSIHCIEIC